LGRNGVIALQNVTANPSLTAVSHIAIATGSTAVHNDIPSNNFHAVAAPMSAGISGFAAPIGGYSLDPLGPARRPTAKPIWARLKEVGKNVVTATWPGADGADIRIDGVVVQRGDRLRVGGYTVPFGVFGGLGATGFTLSRSDFAPDPAVAAQLEAAGHPSFSPVQATQVFETFSCASSTAATCAPGTSLDIKFEMRAAAIDTTDDATVDYDTLVLFEKTAGVQPGPFARPATGPAYARRNGPSAAFFFQGSGNRIGSAYFVSFLAPDLSTARFARYAANYIPRTPSVLGAVDDINTHAGFWLAQGDFRILQRLGPGLASFPEEEAEMMFEDQVKTFVHYQTRVAERAIAANRDADLVMVYIEEPDGSEHQFFLTDPRQATDPRDPRSIGKGQDRSKVRRYQSYTEFAYRQADAAVSTLADAVGPETDIFVVSDHGFAPFHTAVNLGNLLKNAGVDTSQLAIRTSGPVANIYVNLQGRESGGVVDDAGYQKLVSKIVEALRTAKDPNPRFNYSLDRQRIFSEISLRPSNCAAGVGFCTNRRIGQDSGDVFAVMALGYNFDGAQNPGVARLGDPVFDPLTTVLSIPDFYGAHGYDPKLSTMSAAFLAAGPHIRRRPPLTLINNIDVAPTIMSLLGITPKKVDGRVLNEILK
jgi:predicted AlkP superfamily pyrophosphatase or phosphodiesterase